MFTLELETAIANALDESSSLLSRQIVKTPSVPSLFHSEFDNCDQFISTLSSTTSVHTAHGILLQEIISNEPTDQVGVPVEVPSFKKSKNISLNMPVSEELPPIYIGERRSPGM